MNNPIHHIPLDLPTPEQILNNPATSFWLKDALTRSLQRDPVDASKDAELLSDLLFKRAADLLRTSLPAPVDEPANLREPPQAAHSHDKTSVLMAIKKLTAGFFSGENRSATQAGRILMEIEAIATAAMTQTTQHPDDIAIDQFAAAMKAKMAASRAQGQGHWHACHPAAISRMLREHVEKGDPVDVANFCMSLHHLGHQISRPAPVAHNAGTMAHIRESMGKLTEPQKIRTILADIINDVSGLQAEQHKRLRQLQDIVNPMSAQQASTHEETHGRA